MMLRFSGSAGCRGHVGPLDPKWQRESEMSSRDLSTAGVRKIQNGVENRLQSTQKPCHSIKFVFGINFQ